MAVSAAPPAASLETAKFARMASAWWDPDGPMAPLHALNPTRIAFIRDRLAALSGAGGDAMHPLAGLRVLDAGCGGGLMTEPLARLGAEVTGIDPSAEVLEAARAHAAEQNLPITYRRAEIGTVARDTDPMDAVLALEVVEHVPDVGAFLDACARLVRPGGVLIVATINRTAASFALAKVGAEYVLRWLPRGTHQWRAFVRPSEVAAAVRPSGLAVREVTGVRPDPLRGGWTLTPDPRVNYMLVARA